MGQEKEKRYFTAVSRTGEDNICDCGFKPKRETLIHRAMKVLLSPQLAG